MSTKRLIIRQQPVLRKRKNGLILLAFMLLFSFHFSTLASQASEDDQESLPKGSRHVSKRSKILHIDEGLKGAKVQGEESQHASDEDVELVRGKLAKNKKNPPDNYFWNIFFRQQRAGKVSIDLIDEPHLGRHASIQIFLNKASQGKHIGRIAYAKACTLSHYDVVYASMRRNNIASYRSAQAAQFREIKNKTYKQCVMRWVRIR